jgi:formamidopyrimidine-DNA glycosylase
MPELPEVETIVRDLKKEILGRKIEDVWSDAKKLIKKPEDFEVFKKEIKGKEIKDIKRRAKYIVFILNGEKTLLVHQKLTGHFLLNKWKLLNDTWVPEKKGSFMDDPMNKFIHIIFFLDDKRMLALSDLRKFARIELWSNKELKESGKMEEFGPEPLEKDFNFGDFKEALRKKKGRVKQVLMDQTVIAGVGNIYSDEALWESGVHPSRRIPDISDKELEKLYKALIDVLKLSIKLKGESISDYRRISGEKGKFDPMRKVYRREGKECFKCGSKIKRIKIGGRSSYFCPKCQKTE